MARLLRWFIIIPFAYLAACLVGGLCTSAAIYGFRSAPFLTMPEGRFLALGLTATAAVVLAIPALVAIVLAEIRGWRSLSFWAAFGGGIVLVGAVVGSALGMPSPAGPLIFGGVIGGFVYWAIAGRNAGSLRAP